MTIGDFIEDYCCKCERNTIHEVVEDDILEIGLECKNCNIVWEMEDDEGDGERVIVSIVGLESDEEDEEDDNG